MEFNDLAEAGLNVSEGISYTGRDDKYLSAIQRFYRAYQSNREKIEKCREEKDYENYTVLVHALKSNARTIGADELSDMAFELESKGKEKDEKYINEHTSILMSEYERVIDIVSNYGEMEEVKPFDEIDANEALEVHKLLLEALEDFDDEKSLSLVDKLNGYPFRPNQKNKLKEARRYIEDFCYDEATEIIQDMAAFIESE